jgi:hypothetical protein
LTIAWSNVMSGAAAASVAAEMPLAKASCLKAASHDPNWAVLFRQLVCAVALVHVNPANSKAAADFANNCRIAILVARACLRCAFRVPREAVSLARKAANSNISRAPGDTLARRCQSPLSSARLKCARSPAAAMCG